MIKRLKQRWKEDAGYGQLLRVAFPLILSSGSISVMLFIDRMMLSWDSTENMAAALPAGILNWALLCPFFGTALYTSTFVAQYIGANRPERVGASVWQGVYIALIGGAIMPLIAPFAPTIFRFAGHQPEVQALEVPYFQILNFCAVFFLLNTVLSCFYSGRGKAWTIVLANVYLTLLNTLFDYILIFGKLGFPHLGIVGAGYATMASAALTTLLYCVLILSKSHQKSFATRSSWRFEKRLFLRMIRFGVPSGIHFFLDVIGITFFMILIGRMGVIEQTGTNITHQIHLLGLLPLVGLGIANGILVGQYQGARKSELAEKTMYSGLQLSLMYNALVATAYLVYPYIFIRLFLVGHDPTEVQALEALCKDLLKFVAAFTLFESVVILSSSTLKGSGDTKFVMKTLAVTSISLVVIPSYLVIEVFKLPIYYAWCCLFVNLACVSAAFFLRFRTGKWKTIRVIE